MTKTWHKYDIVRLVGTPTRYGRIAMGPNEDGLYTVIGWGLLSFKRKPCSPSHNTRRMS